MKIALLLAAFCIISCASKPPVKISEPVGKPAFSPAPFKFSFRISGSGLGTKPYDMFLMDTNHAMGVHTTKRGANGKFRTINALAMLEPNDFDTLQQLIMKGNLYALDSVDITQVCPEGELYQLDIIPLAAMDPVRIKFSECAVDYNLLLQPQRTYFRKLIEWFERMRTKYRPNQPD